MPIDPSIPLGAHAPQMPSPLQAMEQVYTLRNLATQAQMQPQIQQSLLNERNVQTQERSLQVAKAQREQAEIEATAAAVKGSMEPDPETGVMHPNYEKAASALADQGFGERASGLLETANKMAASRASLREQLGKIQTASLEHRGELALSAIRSLQSGADPETVRGSLIDHLAVGSGDGVISEQDARGLYQAAQGVDPAHLASSLEQFLTPSIRTREATIEKTKAETAKAAAETKVAETKATKPSLANYQAQIDAIVPETDTANAGLRRMTIARVQNARTVEDAEKAIDEASKQIGAINVAKNTVPYKIEVATGGADYGTGANGEVNPTVKAIAEYREAPPPIGRAGTRQIMDAVNRYNPAYDATQYQQRQKVRNAYTTGTEGQQLNALNTAIVHMDLLADAADALKNGTFKPGNQIYNKFADMFGSATPNNYASIKEFLDGEVGSVVKKGVATEGEMGRLEGKGGASSSPEQMAGYIRNVMRILGGKAAVLNDKYHSVMGEADPFSAISPRSQEMLKKHGFSPADFGTKAPTTPSAPGIPGLSYQDYLKAKKGGG